MKWGVVTFPGSLDDRDTLYALRDVLEQDAESLWHKDARPAGRGLRSAARRLQLRRLPALRRDGALLADYGKRGEFRRGGGLVLGICNGFQILCEAHLLPGALTRNRSLSFICERVTVRVDNHRTPFTCAAAEREVLRLPIKHGEGLYVAPQEELRRMEDRGQVLVRYVDEHGEATDGANPNGSMHSIAGVANESFNVFGLMPHPEHAVEPMLGRRRRAQDFPLHHPESGMSVHPVTLPGEPKVDLAQARAHGLVRGRIQPDRAAARTHADLHGIGRFLGHVVGALLVQILAAPSGQASQ